MKIISRFKDFYDFSPQMLGFQPDPVPLYMRDTVNYKSDINEDFVELDEKIPYEVSEIEGFFRRCEDYEFSVIVVCGTGYFIAEKKGKKYYVKCNYGDYFGYRSLFNKKKDLFITDDISTVYKYRLPDIISKKIGAPVYRLVATKLNKYVANSWKGYRNWAVVLDRHTPVLQEYGLGKIIDPNKLYQDIEYWLTSVLASSPDTVPPVEVANDYKIIAAGFDLKGSFRNIKRK